MVEYAGDEEREESECGDGGELWGGGGVLAGRVW